MSYYIFPKSTAIGLYVNCLDSYCR